MMMFPFPVDKLRRLGHPEFRADII